MIPLLVDQELEVFCVGCKAKGAELTIGALYLSPNRPSQLIRFPHKGGIVEIRFPLAMTLSTSPVVAWDITVPYTYYSKQTLQARSS